MPIFLGIPVWDGSDQPSLAGCKSEPVEVVRLRLSRATHTHLLRTPAGEASPCYSPVRNARLLLPRLPRHLIEAEETDKQTC